MAYPEATVAAAAAALPVAAAAAATVRLGTVSTCMRMRSEIHFRIARFEVSLFTFLKLAHSPVLFSFFSHFS